MEGWDSESEKIFDFYLHDYFKKRNMNQTAEMFSTELKFPFDAVLPPVTDAPDGALYGWWQIFYEMYLATTVDSSAPSGQEDLESLVNTEMAVPEQIFEGTRTPRDQEEQTISPSRRFQQIIEELLTSQDQEEQWIATPDVISPLWPEMARKRQQSIVLLSTLQRLTEAVSSTVFGLSERQDLVSSDSYTGSEPISHGLSTSPCQDVRQPSTLASHFPCCREISGVGSNILEGAPETSENMSVHKP